MKGKKEPKNRSSGSTSELQHGHASARVILVTIMMILPRCSVPRMIVRFHLYFSPTNSHHPQLTRLPHEIRETEVIFHENKLAQDDFTSGDKCHPPTTSRESLRSIPHQRHVKQEREMNTPREWSARGAQVPAEDGDEERRLMEVRASARAPR